MAETILGGPTNQNTGSSRLHAVVLVLGDLGRSPRMQYHAQSILEEGHHVTLIGYSGERLVPPLERALPPSANVASARTPSRAGRLHVLWMSPYQPPTANRLWRLLYYPLRLISLLHAVIDALWIRLARVPHTELPVDVVLVQNPPSVPTLLLAYAYCAWQGLQRGRRRRPRLVIDWHNLGYTMFDAPTPASSLRGRCRACAQASIRRLAQWHERTMAPRADAHLTVTRAMEAWLGEHFGVHGPCVRVLHDRPPAAFRPTTAEEQHELFGRLELYGKRLMEWSEEQSMDRTEHVVSETLFTQAVRQPDGTISYRMRHNRPALLVSSTSWTPDEDFSMLLDALQDLHKTVNAQCGDKKFPRVLVIVTGKGPQKAHYLPLLRDFNDTHPAISIHTLWLEASDYPRLLGCATLGISLHTSTSGLDLPMKVLDMFGCQLPVCAVGFECLGELVQDGVNGRIFRDGPGLADLLFELLAGYPGDEARRRLDAYQRCIRGMTRWQENWEESARHLIVGNWPDNA